jgi:hypothetical protein
MERNLEAIHVPLKQVAKAQWFKLVFLGNWLTKNFKSEIAIFFKSFAMNFLPPMHLITRLKIYRIETD